MHTFDVYLKKRLTEIDVVISQLVQREMLDLYSKFYLLMEAGRPNAKVGISSKLQMKLNAELSKFSKTVYEHLNSGATLQSTLRLLNKIYSGGNEVKMEFSIDEVELLRGCLISSDSVLEIFTEPLDNLTELAYFGDYIIKLCLGGAADVNVTKYFEAFDSVLVLKMQGYRQLLDIDDLTLGELDDKTLDEIDWSAITVTYKQIVESNNTDIGLYSEASIVTGHYRLLSEIDDLKLGELDSMTLHDIDYVIN